MALTDLTRISTSGIATGSTIDSPILRKDVDFRGNQVGVTSVLFDSSERELNFKDNVKLTFGDKTNGDLQVYHNGSDNYIDATTGSLYFRNTLPTNTIFQTGNFLIKNQSNNQNVANFAPGANGGGKLYHENVLRFNTTSSGAVVTGVLTATSFSGGISGNTVGNVYAASGISTFYDLRVSNNLTVEGTTTTLDTNLIGVDRVEVGANSNSIVGVAITQSGTADIVNLFDGTTEVLTVKDGGFVGIGTDNPTKLLELFGTDPTIKLMDSSGDAYALIEGDSADQGSIRFRADPLAAGASTHIRFDVDGTERLRIDSNGDLNLGNNPTNQYGYKLNIQDSAIIYAQTASSGGLEAKWHLDNSAQLMEFGTVTTDDLALVTANIPRLRILSNGNIGIGTDTAPHKLSVKGTISMISGASATQIVNISQDGSNNGYIAVNDTSGTTRVRFDSSGVSYVRGGNFGIGDTDPDGNRLLIRGASTVGTKNGHIMLTGDGATNGEGPQIVFSESGGSSNFAGAYIGHIRATTNSVGHLVFGTRETGGDANTVPIERLRITSDGDVGISSTSPRAKLDVKDQGTSKDVILRVSADNNTPYGLVVGNDAFDTTGSRGLAMWVGGGKTHHIEARTSTTQSENTLQISAYKTTIKTGSSGQNDFVFNDNGRLKIGSGTPKAQLDIKQQGNSWEDALLIQHDNANTGWNFHAERTNSALWIGYNSDTSQTLVNQSASQVVHLHSNRTTSLVTSNNSYELTIGGISGGPTLWLRDSGTTGTSRIMFGSSAGALDGAIYYKTDSDYLAFYTNGTEQIRIDTSGHFYPVTDATRDLGTSSLRWRNVYTTDLQLSNENTGGNEVDGTEGNWTLQEGESDIYMINRKTGKKYKMMLQEVS